MSSIRRPAAADLPLAELDADRRGLRPVRGGLAGGRAAGPGAPSWPIPTGPRPIPAASRAADARAGVPPRPRREAGRRALPRPLPRASARSSTPSSPASTSAARTLAARRGTTSGDPRRTGPGDLRARGRRLPRAELSPAALEALRAAGYEILGELGRGGMGVVYLARKLALNRPCALKMILAGSHAGSAAAARFRTEAEAVARLRHPDIVQIYQVGEAGGLPFLELEYLPGGSLDRALDGTPRPPARGRPAGRGAGPGDRRGPRQGDRPPRPQAGQRPARRRRTAQGRRLRPGQAPRLRQRPDAGPRRSSARPATWPPSRPRGDSHLAGAPTDVYALGAILYELLTGRPPFRAATALETLAQVKSAEPVPPSRLQPGLPRDLETICLKCLEKAPGAAVRHGRGPGRGPAPVPGGRADPGPTRARLGAGLEMGPAAADRWRRPWPSAWRPSASSWAAPSTTTPGSRPVLRRTQAAERAAVDRGKLA